MQKDAICFTIYDNPMAKEVLAVPEESLKEVIAVIRSGLSHNKWISQDTRDNLTEWCDREEAYLKKGSST